MPNPQTKLSVDEHHGHRLTIRYGVNPNLRTNPYMLSNCWFQPLWKIWVRQLGWWNFQYMESHKIPWFQTTNQLFIHYPHINSYSYHPFPFRLAQKTQKSYLSSDLKPSQKSIVPSTASPWTNRLYYLVNVYIANWKIPIFHGKIHYKWTMFNSYVTNYPLVNIQKAIENDPIEIVDFPIEHSDFP